MDSNGFHRKKQKQKHSVSRETSQSSLGEDDPESASIDMSAANSSVGASYPMSVDGDETEDDDSEKKSSKKRKTVE